MRLIYLYSFFLIAGMFFSQIYDFVIARHALTFFADIALSYIMMEVGLEFYLDKTKIKSHVKDYCVAALAAASPWLFCFLYFLFIAKDNAWEELLLISRFAAPTSSGILFSMLAAAGMGLTWVFRKVRTLAILDDVDTILLLIPLQFLVVGFQISLIGVLIIVILLLYFAWVFMHKLHLPAGRLWLFGYSIILTAIIQWLRLGLSLELEILLPAFVFGAMLVNPHASKKFKYEHLYLEPHERGLRKFDHTMKTLFMFIVGLLLPKIEVGSFDPFWLTIHVLIITLISNLGKCFPILFYRNEATFKQRAAVSIGMFPRGEVGAGILVLALEHGAGGYATTIAGYSLALNLLMTGIFIWIVVRLVKREVI